MRRLLLAALLTAPLVPACISSAAAQTAPRWSLAIHGGAGVIERDKLTPEQDKAIRAALARALEAGSAILAKGGAALDAVEAAIKVLEDDPHFNAGRGAVLTWDGHNELDAAIMDGRTRAAGAVAGVTATRHPVSLARAVMEKSDHVFLSGAGADAFSRVQKLEQAGPEWFATPERRRQLETLKANKLSAIDVDRKYGTVGAVARDASGHLAAATSTGGITGKRWGRIGDAPVIGAGTYADDRACAVSATGAGEYFIREGVAHEICARIRFAREAPQVAADRVMDEVKALGGDGGVIVNSPDGTIAWSYNTPGMYRGRISAGGKPVVAIYRDEP
ncbi:isoaspartyl peptidase/L-asparaginase [Sphingomonas sp. NBWT7]|uniref:isoaspartyl peptidase/L-asparaginase family protein n=1 Tax=Sphingomonas sp. NBWT7 TaxID=2596913 RepID=UPI0016299821|nr:isoaspartyl peptidase/L-asparaginase [Sphingomonas sp. NBWT7]QNE32789.1 isoaspartyl peptidase/L-asparaginase [Sphingomonas sp. NBWT7]